MEEERYARIEDYLDNVLDAPERQAFEAELLADPALRGLLAEVREVRAGLARQWAHKDADHALETTLQQVGKEHFGRKKGTLYVAPRLGARRRWFLVAAAMLALIVTWLAWPSPSDEKLYAEFRRFPEAAFTTRSNNNQPSATIDKVDIAFNAGRYSDALLQLQPYLAINPNDLEARFFAALCHLELGQTADATTAFQQLRQAPAYTDESNWYLALTFLKEKKRADCIELLHQIPQDSRHYQAAQQLWKELE